MARPRIFLGSSGKQAKLLQALARGLGDVADVEPWTATFNPGTTTLGRLLELTRQVDFAAFVFAQDDWTSAEPARPDDALGGQDRFTGGHRHLAAQDVELKPLAGPDDRSKRALQQRDFIRAVHAVNAELKLILHAVAFRRDVNRCTSM